MFWNFVLCYPSWSSMFSSKSSTLPQGIISEPSMKHPCFSGKLIRNIDDHQCLHRNHQCFINVASMSYCCLFNEQAWFFDDDIIREEENIVRQFFKSSCIPLINMFGLFRCIGLFLFCAISESGCLTSNMVSFFWYLYSVKQFWGPLEATFLSWILSSRLHCSCKLRTPNLKHKDCCFHHLRTLFVEDNIVWQLDLRFLLLLTSSWRRSKIEDFRC